MKGALKDKKILLDSDVIRHFIKGDALLSLLQIFPNRLVMLKNVTEELCRSKSLSMMISNFIAFNKIEEMDFPNHDYRIVKAYAELIAEGRGDGESSIMAVARYNNHIVASSNLRDIKSYCNTHQIEYLTTMDVLVIALNNGLFSEAECDEFIQKVKNRGSKLPVNTIKEYFELIKIVFK